MGRNVGWRARLGLALVGGAAATALVLTGCSSGGSGSSAGSAAADSSGGASLSRPGEASGGQARHAASSAAPAVGHGNPANLPQPGTGQDRKITRDAGVTIRVERIRKAADQVRQVAAREQGYVQSEQIGDVGEQPVPLEGEGNSDGNNGNEFGGEGQLTLSVPADRLDDTLHRLADVGTVTDQWITSQDVTSQYVDTQSRLATQRESVARVRALMQKATRIKDIVTIENELREREATLESLEAQLASLKDNVARSTVEVSLSTTATPKPVPASFPNGFGQGLVTGWHGFVTAVSVVVTVLGVALPFLGLGAVVLVPLAWWWRRRRTAANPTTPATTG